MVMTFAEDAVKILFCFLSKFVWKMDFKSIKLKELLKNFSNSSSSKLSNYSLTTKHALSSSAWRGGVPNQILLLA